MKLFILTTSTEFHLERSNRNGNAAPKKHREGVHAAAGRVHGRQELVRFATREEKVEKVIERVWEG